MVDKPNPIARGFTLRIAIGRTRVFTMADRKRNDLLHVLRIENGLYSYGTCKIDNANNVSLVPYEGTNEYHWYAVDRADLTDQSLGILMDISSAQFPTMQ